MVNPTAGTWQEIYPDTGPSAQATTTEVSASPSGSAQQNASVTLTATEAAADSSHPAGMVQFLQDGFDVGAAVAVNSSGVASTQHHVAPAERAWRYRHHRDVYPD